MTVSSSARSAAFYVVMLGGTLGAFHLIRRTGEQLEAPPPGSDRTVGVLASGASSHPLLHVLVALVAIVVLARLVGTAFRYIGQPPVIGEVVAGIMLGPSLLGRVSPHAQQLLLPNDAAPLLGILAQVGVVLFMFVVGLEFDARALKKRAHASIAISHASIATPFVLGGLLALALYTRYSSRDVPFFVFALFMGVSMSITAFPVLARILTDRGMHRTKLGALVLTCAAVDDVTAWCLLALVVTIARRGAPAEAATTLAFAAAFMAFMVLVARPALKWLAARHDRKGTLDQQTLAALLVGVILAAVTTEAIGIHALFGAFVFGAFIPSHSKLAKDIEAQVSNLVVVLFLPAFFAFTGMRTQLGLLATGAQWLTCGAIVAVAVLGKFGGSFAAAQVAGLGWRDSAAIGALMNTRGLMELIVLNLGLDLKVISPEIFAMMVVMALTTTLMTSPLLSLVQRAGRAEARARLRGTVPSLTER